MSNGCATLSVLPWLQALGVLALAAAGAFIAYQQMQIARTKLQHDLFDRRMKVFEGIAGFLADIATTGKVGGSDLTKFHAATREALFVFPRSIIDTIDEVSKRAVLLESVLNAQGRGNLCVAELQRLIDKEEEHKMWLLRQQYKLSKQFDPLLHIGPR